MNQSEYNNVVHQYADHLYAFLLKNTRSQAVAQDLVQISFEKLWVSRKKIDEHKVKAYLFKIGYNAMIDHFRKNKRITYIEHIPEKRETTIRLLNFELKECLDIGLATLNDLQRSLILLRDYEGYSYKEIGEITDLSESQVKVYLFRARKALREYFLKHHKIEMESYGYSAQ